MNPNIGFIYFDLGDTLVHIRPELQVDSIKRIATARGQTLDSKRQVAWAMAEYKAACNAEWATRFDDILNVRTDADERAYWPDYFAAVLMRMGIASPDQELISLLAARQADPESFAPVVGAKATLERLAHAGIKLGIISNSFPSAEKILDHLDLSQWFKKHLVLSHELLYAKPSPEIYQHAIQLAQQPAAQIMFVDDRPRFVHGADRADLYAVLFDPTGQYQHEWHGQTIRQLAKLTRLVGIEPDHTRRGKKRSVGQYSANVSDHFCTILQTALVAIRGVFGRWKQFDPERIISAAVSKL
jgi:HAD superfamily hydrolase (TIGR01509 family)